MCARYARHGVLDQGRLHDFFCDVFPLFLVFFCQISLPILNLSRLANIIFLWATAGSATTEKIHVSFSAISVWCDYQLGDTPTDMLWR